MMAILYILRVVYKSRWGYLHRAIEVWCPNGKSSSSHYSVEMFAIHPDIESIIEVPWSIVAICYDDISRIMDIDDPWSIFYIARFHDKISFYIYWGKISSFFLWNMLKNIFKRFFISKYFLFFLSILFLWIGYISDHIFLIFETITPDTLMTSYKVGRKPDIRWICDKSTIKNIMRLIYPSWSINIRAVCTGKKRIINVMYIVIAKSTIGYIFWLKAYYKAEIGIFCAENCISKFRAFIVIKMKNILKWKYINETLKILKKTFSSVIFLDIGRCISIFLIIEYFYTIRLWISRYFSISFLKIEYLPTSQLFKKVTKRSFFPLFLDEFLEIFDSRHKEKLKTKSCLHPI